MREDNVIPRLRAMLGSDAEFSLEWVSIYTFQCRRMERFAHGRVLFAGDSAHQVSPFGARGANSGIQDADNLAWKLKLVLDGSAPESLMESYNRERVLAADENILNSTRSTDFITPKSTISRTFRDAVLDLAEDHPFARPLVNSGRLSLPTPYADSALNGEDSLPRGPDRVRPGAPAIDVPLGDGWLLDRLGSGFTVLAINVPVPDNSNGEGFPVPALTIEIEDTSLDALKERYLGDNEHAVYLIRPDHHVAARWSTYDRRAISSALATATGGTSWRT